MILRRIVPNLDVDDATTGHDFYEQFLGLRKEFDMGWVAGFRSPTNPSVHAVDKQRFVAAHCVTMGE